jgi:hypothetical protein
VQVWQASAQHDISTLPTGTLTLDMAEDAYQGDAQFTVSVDGTQVGGIMTTHALQSSGENDVFTLNGNWGSGSHQVSINFINDDWGGTPDTDRNLYVNGIALNGTLQSGTTAPLFGDGSANFTVGGSVAAAAPPADSLTVHLSEDAWNGNAQFVLLIDGRAVTTAQDVTALHSSGNWQDFSLTGNFGAGAHTIGVEFTNDAWGGTNATDRNLYINGIDVNGTHYGSGVTSMFNDGTTNFSVSTAK